MGSKQLSNMYLSTLCLEISMLMHSGFTAGICIHMMLEDEPDKDGKVILKALYNKLDAGDTLGEAMRSVKYFPNYMVSMVEVGEKTGNLTETLKALSKHYERQERLTVSIKNATLYPAVLLGMMIAVVMILIVQVLPIFNDVFARMGTQMSPLAEQLLNFGSWFRAASVVITIIAVAIFVVAFLIWAIPALRQGVVRGLKNRWGGSWVFGRVATYQFISSMSIALSSGLSIEESIELSASLNKESKVLNRKYTKCTSLLRDGSKLADALRGSGILSARDSRMLSIGDQSGLADTAMTEIARRSDDNVQDEISSIVGKIEPSLVIATSVIVGIILLSVMLPLVGIMTSIG